jgi:cholesterol transport system auxiliary component
MSQRISLLLLLTLLGGCGGLPKPGAPPALYDFGIAATNNQEAVPVRLGRVEAAPGVDGHEMRYRLAYQNPARVFAFNESRWATLPADLVAQRIQSRWVSGSDTKCSLHLTLDVFDQVFESPTTSRGVVQLHAELANGSSHNAPRVSTVVTVEKPSNRADAKGGVAALTAATDEAITQLKGWVETQKCGEATP